ncbi:MAG TPA: hypothetical protein VGF59_07895 [Bryobacteraceae bacterium]|jgi:hypothetical protein
MTYLIYGLSALGVGIGSVLLRQTQVRTRRAESEKRCESSLARALSAAEQPGPESAEQCPSDFHALGERLLAALEKEKLATERLKAHPHERSRLEEWLACRADAIYVESAYARLVCANGFQTEIQNGQSGWLLSGMKANAQAACN